MKNEKFKVVESSARRNKKLNLWILGAAILAYVVVLASAAFFQPGQAKVAALGEIKTAMAAIENESGAPSAAPENEIAEREIRAVLEKYYELARSNDRAALKKFSDRITAPEYRYSSETGVMDKATAMRYFERRDLEFVHADFDQLSVQVHGGAAIAKYRDISAVKTNGIARSKPSRFTNVWIKKDGAWRIVAEHSSVAAPIELLPRSRFADNLARK